MSSKGNEERAERVYRENRRPVSLLQIVRFILAVGTVAALVALIAGCAQEPPNPAPMLPTRTVTKIVHWTGAERTVTAPVTNKQIARIIIDASQATYVASGATCPCPEDQDGACTSVSACERRGVQKPFCYPSDVMARPDQIEAVRRRLASR